MNLKVKFLEDRLVKDDSGTMFKKDQVIELPYASAQHWLTRNVAVLFVEKETAAVAPAEPEKPAAKTRGRPPKAV